MKDCINMGYTNKRQTKPLSLTSVGILRRRKVLLLVITLVSLVLSIGGWFAFQNQSVFDVKPAVVSLTSLPSLQDLAAQYPQYAELLNDDELDSVYKDFIITYQQGGEDSALELARTRGVLTENNDLRLTIELDTEDVDPIIKELEGKGILITAVSGSSIDIMMPFSLLDQIFNSDDPGSFFLEMAALEHVIKIRIPQKDRSNYHPPYEYDNPYINAEAWHDAGFTGKGIKIGILDLGFDGYKDLLGTGLPSGVTVKSFRYGQEIDQTGEVHGSACAELIHAVAPEAELFFSAYETDTEEKLATEWFASQGVRIISNSTGGSYGPKDGTSVIANLVNDLTSEYDILWINSAGNQAQTHYRGVFTDTDGDGFHEFDNNGSEGMGIYAMGDDLLALNWDDWEQGSEDYSLLLLNQDMELIASSENIQDGGDDSAEIFSYDFRHKGIYYVAIRAEHYTRPALFDFFTYDSDVEFPSAAGSLLTPADAFGSFTVGAVETFDETLAVYSSQGPTDDGRLKPDISAPTGMQTMTYADKSFAGTSASAPQVAGAAALIWQANPDFSQSDVKDFLVARAVDKGVLGPDNEYGAGRLWLGDPPGVTSTVVPSPLPDSMPTSSVAGATQPSPVRNPPFPSLGVKSFLSLASLICFGIVGIAAFGFLIVSVLPRGLSRKAIRINNPLGSPQRSSQPLVHFAGSRMNTCPHCGNLYRANVKFCSFCGFAVKSLDPLSARPLFCSHCGSQMKPSGKFCPACGRARF